MKSPPPFLRRFIFLPGAQKSASTTLFRLIEQHPEICGSPLKEPHFFSKDEQYSLGLERYVRGAFPLCPAGAFLLDGSQSYLGLSSVPSRIERLVGRRNPRFLIILRNPVDRAESAFRHFSSKPGGELKRSIEQIAPRSLGDFDLGKLLDWEELEVKQQLGEGSIVGRHPSWTREGFPYRYFFLGAYSLHLERYFAVFPRTSFLFFKFEDVVRDQKAAVERSCSFLGLSPPEELRDDLHLNKSLAYRNDALARVVAALKGLLRPLKSHLPSRFHAAVRQVEEDHLLIRRTDSLQSAARTSLVSLFEPEVRKVEGMTGLDLSEWRSCKWFGN